jgi:fibronectin-binding autotransporter adhesin
MSGRDLTTGGNFTNTISGIISGNGSLTQVGPGTLNLDGNNTFSGGTEINGGTLEVDGSLKFSETDVNNGGTLAGTGELGEVNVNDGGTIAPGSNPSSIPSTIRIENLVLKGGSNYNWQIWNATSTAGTGWDLISGGNLTVSANATNKFNLNLWSLNATTPETTGIAQNFNATSDYSWNIGTFTSITGFDTSYFNINTGAINGTGGFIGFNGNFTLSSNGTSLTLNYAAANVSLSGNGTWSNELPDMGNSTISYQPIVIDGSGGNSTNDILTGIEGIVFGSNMTGSSTVNGTDVTIGGGGITNNSSYTQTVDLDMILGLSLIHI